MPLPLFKLKIRTQRFFLHPIVASWIVAVAVAVTFSFLFLSECCDTEQIKISGSIGKKQTLGDREFQTQNH